MKGDYSYPPDEFDVAVSATVPQGVHRAPRSRARRLLSFVAVLVLFPLLAYGVVTWWLEWRSAPQDPPTGAVAGTSAPEDPGTAEPEPTAEEPVAEETATPPAEEATEEPAAPATPEPPPPPPVDLDRPVTVYNATNTSGLAGGAADRVEDAGFTDVGSDNWGGRDPAGSVIYYGTADDLTTAQAVAAALGIDMVQESADIAADGIVVVLGADYDA